MWDLPGPGLEPVSPALAGRFLTTAPPGKSQSLSSYPTISFGNGDPERVIFACDFSKRSHFYDAAALLARVHCALEVSHNPDTITGLFC